MNKYIDLVGRILLALIFLMSGISKIGDYTLTQGYMESAGVPGALLPLVILLEVLGALLIIIGWQTRIAAVGIAGFSIAAAVLFHMNFADQVQMIMFMKNLTIAGGLLVLAAHGAGKLSIDHRRGNQTSQNHYGAIDR